MPLQLLVLSAGSTDLQPGPLRFMVPVSSEELSSAEADMEEEDMEEDVQEDMDPGEAVAQQIIQQAPVAPMELDGQSVGCGDCLLSALPSRSICHTIAISEHWQGAYGTVHWVGCCLLSALLPLSTSGCD